MTPDETLAATTPQLVAAYADAAAEHGRATRSGRYDVANKAHDSLALVAQELRQRGQAGLAELAPLRDSDDDSVAVWAATHTLLSAPAEAEAVLEKVSRGPPSPIRLAAEVTLREWRAGRLSV